MELNKYELLSLKKISKWEKEPHKGFNKKILDTTSKPVDYLIKKIGPENLKKYENIIEATIEKMLYTSTFTISPEKLIKRANDSGFKIDDLSQLKYCNLKLLDDCNRKHINYHEKTAAIQGAAAGLGGGLVATADITTILIQDFHMMQEIAFCYGCDPNDIIEKQIILRILEAAIGGSKVKFKALREIDLLKKIKESDSEGEEEKKGIHILGAKALNDVIETIAVALLIRLLPRFLPVISILISAHSNHEIMEQSGNTAFMVYRKRFIETKYGLLEESALEIEINPK